jgi:hypothetical protein
MQFQFNGVLYTITNNELIIAAVILVVLVLVAIGAYLERRKVKTQDLRNRFGAEYDLAVLTQGSVHKAESKLANRETRVEAMKIRDLSTTERDRFIVEWHNVQSRFVDQPVAAVTEADNQINALLVARGYPVADFEQRAADLSVTYPSVMENYRLAHGVAVRTGDVEATTEELRTVMIQYHAIFDELLLDQKPIQHLVAA